jgi:hypothetical protein
MIVFEATNQAQTADGDIGLKPTTMATKKPIKELTQVERFMQEHESFTPQTRFNFFYTDLLMSVFLEFEKLERQKLHGIEVPKLVREILGDIAKAKIEGKRCVVKEFGGGQVTFELEGHPESWPKSITSQNFKGMFQSWEPPNLNTYLDKRAWPEYVEGRRRVGVWYKVMEELLKKRGLKFSLDRAFTGGWGGEGYCVLTISW